ncbi:MAG TPA: beta-ketoacyl-ACP synthase 3 [Candidatus Limnocylindria bacterium]|nr:beta-ketoacyl-ACP synthase 3 [Candidatus Limnocylindria bacterium]
MNKVIVGTGSYLPERVVTNDDIEAVVTDFDRERAKCTLDQWCRKQMGAVQRRRVAPGEGTSDMGTRAALAALADAGMRAADIDLIVMSTITSDHRVPPSAALVQRDLGTPARFIQIDSACTGFVDALMTADGLLDKLGGETALVIGADAMSHHMDPKRFRAQTIFGDGAGAAVIRKTADDRYGVKAYSTGSSGADGFMVAVTAGGTKRPIDEGVLARREQYMELALKVIPPFGVEKMVWAAREALARAGVTSAQLDWVIPHQASFNIVLDTAKALDMPIEKFIINFGLVGNTSAASIPVALDEANRAGCLRDGHKVLMPAVGAGMAWGAAFLVWKDYR